MTFSLSGYCGSIKNGWFYGEIQDNEKKIHPCIKPYHELPKEQKIKDIMFISQLKVFYFMLEFFSVVKDPD